MSTGASGPVKPSTFPVAPVLDGLGYFRFDCASLQVDPSNGGHPTCLPDKTTTGMTGRVRMPGADRRFKYVQ